MQYSLVGDHVARLPPLRLRDSTETWSPTKRCRVGGSPRRTVPAVAVAAHRGVNEKQPLRGKTFEARHRSIRLNFSDKQIRHGLRLKHRLGHKKRDSFLSPFVSKWRLPTLPLSQYHRRDKVLLLCSEWEELEPLCYHHLSLFVCFFLQALCCAFRFRLPRPLPLCCLVAARRFISASVMSSE